MFAKNIVYEMHLFFTNTLYLLDEAFFKNKID